MITFKLGSLELEFMEKAILELNELAIVGKVTLCDLYIGVSQKRNSDPRTEYTEIIVAPNPKKRRKLIDKNRNKILPNYFYQFFSLGVLYNMENKEHQINLETTFNEL